MNHSPDLSYIHESLRHLAVPIAELVPDPANARRHDEQNLAAIRGSLRQFGQRAPVVVQQEGMIVRAGNGRLTAATQLGWTHVAAIVVAEDNVAAVAFAITDNRTAELADWDTDTLDRLLREINVGDEDLQTMLAELAEDAGVVPDLDDEPAEDESDQLRDEFSVLITCEDETQQAELLERFSREGLNCRALFT
jgi:ParB-like chromosome segregation protein Spo0J